MARDRKMLLMTLPFWAVDRPNYSLAWMGGVLAGCDWKYDLVDGNIDLFHLVKPDDQEFWTSLSKQFDTNSVEDLYGRYEDMIHAYLREHLERSQPDILAFNVTPFARIFTRNALKHLRQMDISIPVILGGSDCFPAEFGKGYLSDIENAPDMICQGESEVCLPELLEGFGGGSDYPTDIKGFAYRSGEEVVDCGEPQLPNLFTSGVIADHSQLDFGKYTRPFIIPTSFSRGCIRRCTFCSEAPNFKQYRTRNPDDVIREIRSSMQYAEIDPETGGKVAYFCESAHNGDIEAFKSFVGRLAEEAIEDLTWSSIMLFRKEMTPELIDKMKRSGCWGVYWGFESGSQHVLDMMRKKVKIELSTQVIADLHAAGVNSMLPTIAGFPGETVDDFIESMQFIASHRKYAFWDDAYLLQVPRNSPLHTEYKKFGLVSPEHHEWVTTDGRNTRRMRMLKSILLNNMIHDTCDYDQVLLRSLDFNELPVASAAAGILLKAASGASAEASAAAQRYLHEFKDERVVELSQEELGYWQPGELDAELDLRNFFECDKNGPGVREEIVRMICDAMFWRVNQSMDAQTSLDALEEVAPPTEMSCYLDSLDKAPLSPGETQEIRIKGGGDALVGGWSIDPYVAETAHATYLKCGEKLFRTDYGYKRSDVAVAIGSEKCMNSGFSRRIFASELEAGSHPVSVVVVSKDEKRFWQIPSAQVIAVS